MKLTQKELEQLSTCISERIERLEKMLSRPGNSEVVHIITQDLTSLDNLKSKIEKERID